MRSGTLVGPWRRVQACADRDRHEFVVRRVVLDLVDTVAVAVVCVEHGLVAIGQLAPALRLCAAAERSEFGDLVDTPVAALADQRLDEYG